MTPEPATVTVTEVDPTPLWKAFIMPGLIDPSEQVKDGVPLKLVTVLPYTSSAITVIVKASPAV